VHPQAKKIRAFVAEKAAGFWQLASGNQIRDNTRAPAGKRYSCIRGGKGNWHLASGNQICGQKIRAFVVEKASGNWLLASGNQIRGRTIRGFVAEKATGS